MNKTRAQSREHPLRLTAHAQARVRQRGYRGDDLDLVLQHGTAGAEAAVLTRLDVDHRVRALKKEIQALERLSGTAVVTGGEAVKTVYRPDKRRMRRMLRHSSRDLARTGGQAR